MRECHLSSTLALRGRLFYLGLSAVLLAVLAGFGKGSVRIALAYLGGAAIALLGARVVAQSHEHYVAARAHLNTIEQRLGLIPKGLTLPTPTVTTAAKLVLTAIAVFDVLAAILSLLL